MKIKSIIKLTKNNILSISILICFVNFVFAQSVDTLGLKFISNTHTFQNNTLSYRLYIPQNYNESKSYPILLCLHGAGERGSDNDIHIVRHSLATAWAEPEIQKKNPTFILAPQCPKKKKWSYTDWNKGSLNIDTLAIGKEMRVVVNLLDALLNEFNIDKNRQYVTGLSMGGYGTWDIITRYPNRFAAAVPMSGAGDPSKVHLYKNLPIWNFHNTNDKIVPVEGSREIFQAMKKSKFKVLETLGISEKKINRKLRKKPIHIYTENPEGNHGPWEPWYNYSKLHNWLFSQVKEKRIIK